MSFQPVLPLWLLALLAVVVVAARIVALRRLAPAGRTRGKLWRWASLTLVTLLLIATAARPVIDPSGDDVTRVADPEAPNVFLVVDRSPDMRVQDYSGGAPRMDGVRADVAEILDAYPGARVALISFASRSALDWPLSADTWSLSPVTAALSPYASAPDTVNLTNAGAAGNALRYQLNGAIQQYPRAKNLVFYFGAGAPESDGSQLEFDLPEGAVGGGAVFGYGTERGGPIPGTDVARAAIDEPALRDVADQIGVPYLTRDGVDALAPVLPTDTTAVASDARMAGEGAGRIEVYWASAIAAAALILVELYLVLVEFRRTRINNANVFS